MSISRSSLLVGVFLLVGGSRVLADPLRATESQIKAAYLYNFTKFVEWPPEVLQPDQELSMCIYGEAPEEKEMILELEKRRAEGKKLAVKRVGSPNEAQACQVLYIGASQRSEMETILMALARLPILTVSDIRRFTRHQGMIEFIMEDSRVRFGVNAAAAQQANLKISSQLLKVAKTVEQ